MNNLVKIAVALAFAAVASGNIPRVLHQVRKAQIHLIVESQASLPKREKYEEECKRCQTKGVN